MPKALLVTFAIFASALLPAWDIYNSYNPSPVEYDEAKFIVYRKDEIEGVNKILNDHFNYVKSVLGEYKEFKDIVSKIKFSIINTGAIVNHTSKIDDNFIVYTSYGSYRQAMSMSILFNNRQKISSLEHSQCVDKYFKYISEFEQGDLGNIKLAPRIDKFIKIDCPDISKEMEIYARNSSKMTDDMLFLVRLWFFHEIAHIIYGHFDISFSKEMELYADNFAIRYSMLTAKMEYEEIFTRMMIYFSLSVSFNGHDFGDRSKHPPAPERFANMMSSIIAYYDWVGNKDKKAEAEAFFKKIASEFAAMTGLGL